MPVRPWSFVSLLVIAMAAGALAGCSGDEEGEGTPTPIVPTASITLTASPAPTDAPAEDEGTPGAGEPRRTGDAELDAIIEAVEARDVAALAPLVELVEVGCTFAEGLGGPPKCAEGMEEGTLVREFPFASCEGAWSRFGVETVARFAHQANGPWAVLDVEEYWPSTDGRTTPDTFIVFHSPAGPGDSAAYLEIADGRIVRASFGCGGTVQSLLDLDVLSLAVTAGPWDEPIEAASVEAPTTGIEAVDRVLRSVAEYDWSALREGALDAMALLPDAPCGELPLQELRGVECDPKNGETAGAEVDVFPVAYCEGALVRDPMDALRGFLDGVPQLYAVVEAPSEPSGAELYPHGAYWLVYELAHSEGEPGARLHVTEDGNVTAMWFGCNTPLEELVQWGGEPLREIEVREE